MKEVLNYLKENPVLFVGTVDKNQARVRPFTAKAVFEDKLYIGTNNQKPAFKQMIENENIEICVMGKDNTWMRIEAKIVHDNRREARVQMMTENPNLSRMYNVDDNLMEVLYLKDAIATIYSSLSEILCK